MVKVLLVDDDSLVRSTIALQMEIMGHAVLQAANADEALRQVREAGEIELVVTDVNMPGRLNGLGLAEELAGLDPHLPVLLISGYAFDGDLSPEATKGPRQFLAKPFRLKALSEKIRLCMSRFEPDPV